jgi:hypothetical protein
MMVIKFLTWNELLKKGFYFTLGLVEVPVSRSMHPFRQVWLAEQQGLSLS